jgi:hypothetical protein
VKTVKKTVNLRGRPRFVTLKNEGDARPLCDLCGAWSRKRALFQHLWTERVLCAKCAVRRILGSIIEIKTPRLL